VDCIDENTMRLEVRRLMLEADKREQDFIFDAPVAENVAWHIGFELNIKGEVDEVMQEHYLTGPKYNPHMTPTEEYIRWIATQRFSFERGPEPMLDRP